MKKTFKQCLYFCFIEAFGQNHSSAFGLERLYGNHMLVSVFVSNFYVCACQSVSCQFICFYKYIICLFDISVTFVLLFIQNNNHHYGSSSGSPSRDYYLPEGAKVKELVFCVCLSGESISKGSFVINPCAFWLVLLMLVR